VCVYFRGRIITALFEDLPSLILQLLILRELDTYNTTLISLAYLSCLFSVINIFIGLTLFYISRYENDTPAKLKFEIQVIKKLLLYISSSIQRTQHKSHLRIMPRFCLEIFFKNQNFSLSKMI
jgi:hypothetical protein